MNRSIILVVVRCIIGMLVAIPAVGAEMPSLEDMQNVLPILNDRIQRNPGDAEALAMRGAIRQHMGQTDSAVDDCSRAIGIDPSKPEPYCVRFICYMQTKDYQNALKDANDVVRLKPCAGAYNNRATVYTAVHNYPQAIADYTKCLRYDGSLASAYDGLGEVAYRLKRYNDAIAYFNRALYLDPKLIGSTYYRGKSYEALGKRDLAKKDLDRARTAGYKEGDLQVTMGK